MVVAVNGADPSARLAESPLATLRQEIDSRLAALSGQSALLERELLESTAQRANANQLQRLNDETRERLLGAVDRVPLPQLVRSFHDGLALRSDRAALEERVVSLRQQLNRLASERSLLQSVLGALGRDSASDVEIDVRSAQLSQAARRIYRIVDDEHEAMAHEILDGPMQRLSDAAMDAEVAGRALSWDAASAVESVARCRTATVEAATGLQQRLERLAPIDAHQSLPQAIRQLLTERAIGERTRFHVMGPQRRLDPFQELVVFRVVEAALDNAVRHGQAEHIEVVLSYHRDRVSALVKDDGEGFDVVATEARMGRTRGLGLIQMHERAQLAGGRLDVRSQVGAGTEVRLAIPATR